MTSKQDNSKIYVARLSQKWIDNCKSPSQFQHRVAKTRKWKDRDFEDLRDVKLIFMLKNVILFLRGNVEYVS